MSLISPDMSGIVDGSAATAAAWTTPMQTIIDVINGGLDSDNISDNSITNAKIQAQAWTDWTPTLYKTDHSTTISGTKRHARYQQRGKTIRVTMCYTGIADPGGITIYMSLPVAPRQDSTYATVVGGGVLQGTGTTARGAIVFIQDSGTVANLAGIESTASVSTTLPTAGDIAIYLEFTYEAA